MMLTVTSVLRSHFDEVGESQRVCHRAVFATKGTLGNKTRNKADGDVSMADDKT